MFFKLQKPIKRHSFQYCRSSRQLEILNSTDPNFNSISGGREGEFWDMSGGNEGNQNGASIYMNRQKMPTSASINTGIQQSNQKLSLNEHYMDPAQTYCNVDNETVGDDGKYPLSPLMN